VIDTLSTSYVERDIDGLTDRTYFEVVGRCVISAGVSAMLFELAVTVPTPYIIAVEIGFIGAFAYLFSWVGELLRQTLLYLRTRRYGGGLEVSR